MQAEKYIFEKKEDEPKDNVVTAYFLRHGRSEYLETNGLPKDESINVDALPLDLTPEGQAEIQVAAERVADKINPEKDIVVFWSSPAWRAQGSEKIVRAELEKRGIPIYKDSAISSMKYLEQYDMDYMNGLWKDLASTGQSTDALYAHDPMFQKKNDKFESQPEVKKRAEQVLNYIRYIAEHIDLNGKRLCIVGVSHFEFLNPIMEEIFGPKAKQDQGIKKGEDLTINFDYSPTNKKMLVSADFRGEHKDDIIFDKENRQFVAKQPENNIIDQELSNLETELPFAGRMELARDLFAEVCDFKSGSKRQKEIDAMSEHREASAEGNLKHYFLPGIPGGEGEDNKIREGYDRRAEYIKTDNHVFMNVGQGEMWVVPKSANPYFKTSMSECGTIIGEDKEKISIAHISYSATDETEAVINFMKEKGISPDKIFVVASAGSSREHMTNDSYRENGISPEHIKNFACKSGERISDKEKIFHNLTQVLASKDGFLKWSFDLKQTFKTGSYYPEEKMLGDYKDEEAVKFD